MGRALRRAWALAALALLLLPALAQAKTGALDAEFGAGGRVLAATAEPTEFESRAQLRTAAAPEGKTVALGGGQVMQFLADGEPDPGFGSGGRVTIAVEPGRGFEPAGVAVDPQGRIVVAGTSSSVTEPSMAGPDGAPSGPGPLSATVIRYLPSGAVDPSFGKNGIATTTFGIAPPTDLGVPSFVYKSAIVTVAAVTVTSAGQPVVAGSYALSAGSCGAPAYGPAGYVARLDASGNPDQSFGNGGVARDPQIDAPEVMTQSASTELFYSGRTAARFVGACMTHGPQSVAGNFADLLPSGQLNPGFGNGGERPHNQSAVGALAADSRGRLVALEESWPSQYPEGEAKLRVQRLLPNGMPDQAFGRNGSVWPEATPNFLAPTGFATLAVDSRNRILLAGGGRTKAGALGFQLMRLGTKGKTDRGFGQRGRVKTGFGTAAQTKATQITLDEDGRIVLAGVISGSPNLPGGQGFAFARYLGS